MHSYPFCWRSDTPLIYKAVPSWFVRVEEIKPQVRRSASAQQCRVRVLHCWMAHRPRCAEQTHQKWCTARCCSWRMRRPGLPSFTKAN